MIILTPTLMRYECIVVIYRANTQLAICESKQSIHQIEVTNMKVGCMVLLYIISLFTFIIIDLKKKLNYCNTWKHSLKIKQLIGYRNDITT